MSGEIDGTSYEWTLDRWLEKTQNIAAEAAAIVDHYRAATRGVMERDLKIAALEDEKKRRDEYYTPVMVALKKARKRYVELAAEYNVECLPWVSWMDLMVLYAGEDTAEALRQRARENARILELEDTVRRQSATIESLSARDASVPTKEIGYLCEVLTESAQCPNSVTLVKRWLRESGRTV